MSRVEEKSREEKIFPQNGVYINLAVPPLGAYSNIQRCHTCTYLKEFPLASDIRYTPRTSFGKFSFIREKYNALVRIL